MELVNQFACAMLRSGISVIPIATNKQPAVKWKKLQAAAMSPEQWMKEFGNCNAAIATGEFNNLVIVDCDSYESYVGWACHRTPTPLRVRTRRGVHFYYRHPGVYVKSDSHVIADEGFTYDVKGDNSYALLPPSMQGGWQYQFCICTGNPAGGWIPPARLPVFNPEWRPDRRPASSDFASDEIRDVRAYISHIVANEGQGGDRETFRVCNKIKASGVDMTEGMAVLSEWNVTNANPPWSAPELLRKLRIAYGERT